MRSGSAALLLLMSSTHAHAQAAGPEPEPEPRAPVEEPPTPDVDFDGTERHDWWTIAPNLKLRLLDETAGDERLRDWPTNLVEGRQTTAGVFELSHTNGPLTFRAGVGLGVATTRAGGPADLTFVEREQRLTGVATVGVTLRLPGRWRLGLGATATGTDVKVGVTAEKDF